MHIRIHCIQALLTASVKKEPQKRLQKSRISSKSTAALLSLLSWAANENKLLFTWSSTAVSQANSNTSEILADLWL